MTSGARVRGGCGSSGRHFTELLAQGGQVRADGRDGRVVVAVGLAVGRERLLVEDARDEQVAELLE